MQQEGTGDREGSVAGERAARRPIITLENASKVYRMGQVDVRALREADLTVFAGELLVVVGPSGSGKSTLLNLIGGMDRPSGGRVWSLGKDLGQATDDELTAYRRVHVGFVFQFYNLVPSLTARENVEVAVELADDPLDAMEVLDRVGLADRADHFPAQLSGGEQQRVAIARALAGRPSLLLCDEPTGALDLERSREVLGVLTDLNRNMAKTMILITHNSAIAGIGSRIARMRDGAIHTIDENPNPVPVEEIQW